MKNIKLILLSTILILSNSVKSQTLDWAKQISGSTSIGNCIKVDSAYNTYTVGAFSSVGDFDPNSGTYNLTSGGGFDIFIQKLDSAGNLIWAKRIGGINDDRAQEITIGIDGSIYVVGRFEGTVDFDPGSGIFNLVSGGWYDAFILKLDSVGNFIWAKNIGNTNYDRAFRIEKDKADNIYILGEFDGTVDFNPAIGVFNLTSTVGARSIFLLKLDSAGNFVWAKKTGGIGNDGDIAIDQFNNLYTTGYFLGTRDFDPGSGTFNLSSTNSYEDAYIQKLDSSGNFVWAKRIGGSLQDEGHSITLDKYGDLYICGSYRSTVDFDPNGGVHNLSALSSWRDVFILKLDSGGNFIWAQSTGSRYIDFGNSIVVDSNRNTFITGLYNNFSRPERIFLEKRDSLGNLIWHVLIGNGTYFDGEGIGMDIDAQNNLYVTGVFDGNCDFDPEAGTYFLNAGTNSNAFQLKLFACDHIYDTINYIHCISNDSVFFAGKYRKTPGLYYDTFSTSSQCDSIIILNFKDNKHFLSQSICSNDSLLFNGVYIKTAGLYNDTISTVAGCDSIVELTLSIRLTSTYYFSDSVCFGDSLQFYGTYLKIAGIYKTTLLNSASCDSVVTINFKTTTIPTTTIINTNNILSVPASSGQFFLWLNCDSSYKKITGETSSQYIPTQSGNYAVIIQRNGCLDTTACFNFNNVSLNKLKLKNSVSLYPNPSKGTFILDLKKEIELTSLFITDINGRLVKSIIPKNTSKYNINFKGASGIYFLTIRAKNEKFILKLVKE